MNCNECHEWMEKALELELDPGTEESFRDHLDACPDCRKEYEEMQWIIEALGDLPVKPLPENFKAELHEKLVAAQTAKPKSTKNTGPFFARYGKWISIAAVFMLVVGLGSNMLPQLMGGYKTESAVMDGSFRDASNEAGYGEEAPAAPASMPSEYDMATNAEQKAVGLEDTLLGIAPTAPQPPTGTEFTVNPTAVDTPDLQGRKVIQTGGIELEVKVYNEAEAAIKTFVQGAGGYIQDSSAYYYLGSDGQTQLKAGYLTIRVPQGAFDTAYSRILELGKAVSQSSNAQDISQQYRDTYNEKLNLEVREEQLRQIMAKAEKIEDIILVEGELSRVRGQINALAGTLQQWDSLVNLSTITINMREVEDFTSKIEPIKKDLWTKAVEAFNESMNQLKRSFENSVIFMIAFLPRLVIYLITGGLFYLIGRWIYKKFKKGWKKS